MSWTIDSGGLAATPFLNNATYGTYTIPYWTFTGNNGKFVSKSAGEIHRTQSGNVQSSLGFISGSSDFADLVSITNETPSQATSITFLPINSISSGTLISSYSGSRKVIVYLVGAGGGGGSGKSTGPFGWLGGAGGGGGGRLIAYSVNSSYYISAAWDYFSPSWVGNSSNPALGTQYLVANSGGPGGSVTNVTIRATGGSGGGYSSASGFNLYCASNGASGSAGGGGGGGSSAASATYWAGSLTLSASSGGAGASSGCAGGGGGGSSGNGGAGGNEVSGTSGTAPGGGGGGGGANFGNGYGGGSGAQGTAIVYW